MKNILIFGSNGMLGTYLTKYLTPRYNVIPLTRANYDISFVEQSELNNFISVYGKPDLIINAAGVIKQRLYKPVDLITVNSLFPHYLAEYGKEFDVKIIHITTDCVFNGKTGGYFESDKHDAFDDYGKSKSLGENPNSTVIRTSIIGEELHNKVSLLEWVKSNKGKTIKGYGNHLWNGVTCLELAQIIDKIITTEGYWEGVRHIFSETVNKFELVYLIGKIFELDITVERVNPDDFCYRNLRTEYTPWKIKTLYEQLVELKDFKITN